MKIEESIKRYNLIIGLIILFFGLIFARNIYKDQNREISSLKERIREWEEKGLILKDIQSLESRLKEYKEKFKKPDTSALIEELTESAGGCNLKVSSIRPEPEIIGENIVSQPVTMNLIGGYHNVRKLVSILEKNPQIKIEEINLSQTIEEGKAKDLKIRILINLISFK